MRTQADKWHSVLTHIPEEDLDFDSACRLEDESPEIIVGEGNKIRLFTDGSILYRSRRGKYTIWTKEKFDQEFPPELQTVEGAEIKA